MKLDKFFKWIWNFNGVILFLGIIIGATFIGFELSQTLLRDNHNETPTLNLAADEADEEKWSLGYPNAIGDKGFYYIPLESVKLFVKKKGRIVENFNGSSYNPTRAKNVIFINGKTNTSVWLFKSVNQLITDIRILKTFEYSPDS